MEKADWICQDSGWLTMTFAPCDPGHSEAPLWPLQFLGSLALEYRLSVPKEMHSYGGESVQPIPASEWGQGQGISSTHTGGRFGSIRELWVLCWDHPAHTLAHWSHALAPLLRNCSQVWHRSWHDPHRLFCASTLESQLTTKKQTSAAEDIRSLGSWLTSALPTPSLALSPTEVIPVRTHWWEMWPTLTSDLTFPQKSVGTHTYTQKHPHNDTPPRHGENLTLSPKFIQTEKVYKIKRKRNLFQRKNP